MIEETLDTQGLNDIRISIMDGGIKGINCWPSYHDHNEVFFVFIKNVETNNTDMYYFSLFEGKMIWHCDRVETIPAQELTELQNYLDNHWSELIDGFIKAYNLDSNIMEFDYSIDHRRDRSYYPEKAPVLHC